VIAGLVLAAGAGTRFGGGKQVAELEGRPLLEHVLRTMDSAPLDRVVVVLGARADEVLAAVDLHGAEPLVCERWEEGQSASLACGLAELADAEAVVVVLGDQPRLSVEAIERVVGGREDEPAVRATYGGRPGHPVLLSRQFFSHLRDLAGDRGARSVLDGAVIREVPCDDLGGGEDVDTPEDLASLRSGGARR
jgi:CTP:molybdopterin cytidylyltransferase MocA